MVKRIAPISIVCFVLSAACVAVCQSSRQALPDAPSVQSEDQAPRLNDFQKAWPLKFGGDVGAMAGDGFATADERLNRRDSTNIFNKLLYPSSMKQGSMNQGWHFQSGSGGSLMGRATYAASRIFVTRDESGKGRLNTSYFLRVLTSVAAESASRPYWRRSAGQPLSDFGSTVGNDAGMNVLHEFTPNIQQMMKSHAPRFVSRIEARIGQR